MADEKVYMLNALWFKKDGGAEKYAEYAAAAGPSWKSWAEACWTASLQPWR